ncbi:hypothetical protein BGW38_008183 [Lunasporangiospora selenospora]|uniref:Uncharacterized protein n=1 Tax=Lunasporangiospora selenospora TaxID=979761 RepID=A0A9P6G077_9FUNG|nr:hypothetical protein BGW38_008183 [Lunasporangiospora selenospora]
MPTPDSILQPISAPIPVPGTQREPTTPPNVGIITPHHPVKGSAYGLSTESSSDSTTSTNAPNSPATTIVASSRSSLSNRVSTISAGSTGSSGNGNSSNGSQPQQQQNPQHFQQYQQPNQQHQGHPQALPLSNGSSTASSSSSSLLLSSSMSLTGQSKGNSNDNESATATSGVGATVVSHQQLQQLQQHKQQFTHPQHHPHHHPHQNPNSGLRRFPSIGNTKKLTVENQTLRAKIAELERYLTGLKEELILAHRQIHAQRNELKSSQDCRAVEISELTQQFQRCEVELVTKAAECVNLQERLLLQQQQQQEQQQQFQLQFQLQLQQHLQQQHQQQHQAQQLSQSPVHQQPRSIEIETVMHGNLDSEADKCFPAEAVVTIAASLQEGGVESKIHTPVIITTSSPATMSSDSCSMSSSTSASASASPSTSAIASASTSATASASNSAHYAADVSTPEKEQQMLLREKEIDIQQLKEENSKKDAHISELLDKVGNLGSQVLNLQCEKVRLEGPSTPRSSFRFSVVGVEPSQEEGAAAGTGTTVTATGATVLISSSMAVPTAATPSPMAAGEGSMSQRSNEAGPLQEPGTAEPTGVAQALLMRTVGPSGTVVTQGRGEEGETGSTVVVSDSPLMTLSSSQAIPAQVIPNNVNSTTTVISTTTIHTSAEVTPGGSFGCGILTAQPSASLVNSVGYDIMVEHRKLLAKYQALRIQHAQTSEYVDALENENRELRIQLLDVITADRVVGIPSPPPPRSNDSSAVSTH